MQNQRSKRILSVSYKDDTPAFKSVEFFKDYANGFRLLPTKVGTMKISLRPEDVYAFVFWTKNPSDHFLSNLKNIRSPFYIQWTISGYGKDLEVNLPPKDEVVDRFINLAKAYPGQVIWRYDPILMNEKYTVAEHVRMFSLLASRLAPYTGTCVISFIDEYGKIASRIKNGEMRAPTMREIRQICSEFSKVAASYGLRIQTCSEGKYDLSEYGIHEGPCIDPKMIERLTGETLPQHIKTPNSFRRCQCAVNTDIGSYHSCWHGCKYCYAQ